MRRHDYSKPDAGRLRDQSHRVAEERDATREAHKAKVAKVLARARQADEQETGEQHQHVAHRQHGQVPV